MTAEDAVVYLKILEVSAPRPVAQVAVAAGDTPRQARRALERLCDAGLVRSERRGYVLTGGGRQGLVTWRERGGR